MNEANDVRALIEMLERVVTEGALTDHAWNQLAQVEYLIRYLQSGQADPELVTALLTHTASLIAPGKLRLRSTDSPEQQSAGLTARAMKLADDLFSRLSQTQRDQFSREMATHDGPSHLAGRRPD